MATVVMHAVVSVDGFIADENDDVGPLFEWYFNGDVPIVEEGAEERHAVFRVSERSHAYVSSLWGSIGATIQGRHLFDLTNGWEAEPPAGDHLVVVSHRPKPDGLAPRGRRPVLRRRRRRGARRRRDGPATGSSRSAPGNVGGQALALGLVDEVAMDVVPVVFGTGKRYFGPVDSQQLLEDPSVVIQGDRVLHLRYRVRR